MIFYGVSIFFEVKTWETSTFGSRKSWWIWWIHGKRLHNFCHFSFVFWMEGLPIPKKMAEANKKNGSGVMFFEGLSCMAVVGGLKEFATVLSIAPFLITQLHKVMINVKDESWRLTRSELPCGFQLHHHDSPWGFIDLLFWCWLATFGLERTGISFFLLREVGWCDVSWKIAENTWPGKVHLRQSPIELGCLEVFLSTVALISR